MSEDKDNVAFGEPMVGWKTPATFYCVLDDTSIIGVTLQDKPSGKLNVLNYGLQSMA